MRNYTYSYCIDLDRKQEEDEKADADKRAAASLASAATPTSVIVPAVDAAAAPFGDKPDGASTSGWVDASVENHGCAKEAKLVEERMKLAVQYVAENATWVTKPSVKSDWENLFSTNALIVHRASLVPHGRHAWYYDASNDTNGANPPAASDGRSHRSASSQSPMPQPTVANPFFDCAMKASAKTTDVCIAPDCQSAQGAKEIKKLLSGLPKQEVLHIIYKEEDGHAGKWQKLNEDVHCAFDVAPPKGSAGPRLHHPHTSTGSDTIVLAKKQDSESKFTTKEEKEAILGSASLTAAEELLDSKDNVQCFLHEKTIELTEEIFHHFGLSTACIATFGKGNAIIAALNLSMKVLAIGKSQSHIKVGKHNAETYIFEQSFIREDKPYFVSRARLIHLCFLEPDPVAVPKQLLPAGEVHEKTVEPPEAKRAKRFTQVVFAEEDDDEGIKAMEDLPDGDDDDEEELNESDELSDLFSQPKKMKPPAKKVVDTLSGGKKQQATPRVSALKGSGGPPNVPVVKPRAKFGRGRGRGKKGQAAVQV